MTRTLALLLWLVPAWGTLLPKAEAQREATLALARVCVSEARPTWSAVETRECSAIAAVLRSRFGRITRRSVCAYSPRSCDKRRGDRRWIAHLRTDARRPDYWPRHLRWSRRRGAWREHLVRASRLVAGERLDRCSERPEHWGAPHFTSNARAMGWVRVDCGPVSNWYWRTP